MRALLLVLALFAAAPALAQTAKGDATGPCAADAKRLCPDTDPV